MRLTAGRCRDEANKYAEGLVEEAGADKARLVHPFEGESTWQGHATLVDEVAAEIESPPAAVVTVVGGERLHRNLRQRTNDRQRQPLYHIDTEIPDARRNR